eukprot:snap_masked-scaffold_1-processed-gene-31.15-mRNA-1 protein AED:1.00 eAED:1.00 QI:0/0/0/0/1/1/3/0/68
MFGRSKGRCLLHFPEILLLAAEVIDGLSECWGASFELTYAVFVDCSLLLFQVNDVDILSGWKNFVYLL